MKKIHQEELYIKQNNLVDQIFEQDSIFFDIETTGFSPQHSTLYLIGCARKSGSSILVDQFFAETPEDENKILMEFLNLLEQYQTVITFNGIGFDIPYLKAKCKTYHIKDHFQDFEYIDIFKTVSSLKFLLQLQNYKQKTIESFLGLCRNDQYHGGELINIYNEYVTSPSDEKKSLLLLHNYEDVIGMIDLLPLLSYSEFFHDSYTITGTELSEYQDYRMNRQKELLITMKCDYPVPQKVSCSNQGFYLSIAKEKAKLRVPVYQGELHYFYPNYKDYYYLPAEDLAIHKSVASFVDKNFREKAKPSNCYNRKSGEFLPQYEEIMKPLFRHSYKDAVSYFEITKDFCTSDIMLRRYIDHILEFLQKKKKPL